MFGRRVFALIALALIAVMMGALVHEIFDFHDTRPFPVDPEFPAMACSFLVALCFSVAASTVCLLTFRVLYFGLTAFLRGFPHSTVESCGVFRCFEIGPLLFSPPSVFTSLRI